jgi:hypothetical protein
MLKFYFGHSSTKKMAGRSYIYIHSEGGIQDSVWDAVAERLTGLAPSSENGFYLGLQEDGKWLLIDVVRANVNPMLFAIATRRGVLSTVIPTIAELTSHDIFGFEYQTVVDGFAYWHYRDQTLLRHFDFGMDGEERTWNALSGTPEPWEDEVFFSEEHARYHLEDLADSDEDATEIAQIFNDRKLKLGSMFPYIGDGVEIPFILQLPGTREDFVSGRDLVIRKPKRDGWLKRVFGLGK